jgi:cysteine synthase A
VVTLICDGGDRYAGSYYDDAWLASQGIDITEPRARLARLAHAGQA